MHMEEGHQHSGEVRIESGLTPAQNHRRERRGFNWVSLPSPPLPLSLPVTFDEAIRALSDERIALELLVRGYH